MIKYIILDNSHSGGCPLLLPHGQIMRHEFQQCPICKNAAAAYCIKGSSVYFSCSQCGSLFQYPPPSVNDMASYVNQEYSSGGTYSDYFHAKDLKYATFRRRIKQMHEHIQGNRLIDIGCSCGYFIDVALEAGYDVYGVEFSSAAIAAASDKSRGRIIQCDINRLDTHGMTEFEIVTAFDVIEHTFNPLSFLKSLRAIMKSGATVVITTPDTKHFLRYLMQSRWPMLQSMQHTFLFSENSLRLALQQTGFSQIHIAPARKILTPGYLMMQLKQLNPFLFSVYKRVSPVFPQWILNRPLFVNIGEIMATAHAS
jgi:2-polyprenyl-3-methyl-5-hydroxy-6-metoxy-1,4-benzoquinol methylase